VTEKLPVHTEEFIFDRLGLDDAARWLFDKCASHAVWLFDAPMGAGKTTLIRAIIRRLDAGAFLGSPTFSIVHEYEGREGEKIFHFDLYRLKRFEELADIGFDMYLDRGDLIFVEWPEKALPFLDDYCRIRLEIIDPQTRRLILEKPVS